MPLEGPATAHTGVQIRFKNSAMYVSAIGEPLSAFWPTLYCACAETVISELPVEISTLPLESATPISYMVRILWRSLDFYHVTIKLATGGCRAHIQAGRWQWYCSGCSVQPAKQSRRRPPPNPLPQPVGFTGGKRAAPITV